MYTNEFRTNFVWMCLNVCSTRRYIEYMDIFIFCFVLSLDFRVSYLALTIESLKYYLNCSFARARYLSRARAPNRMHKISFSILFISSSFFLSRLVVPFSSWSLLLLLLIFLFVFQFCSVHCSVGILRNCVFSSLKKKLRIYICFGSMCM